MSKGGSGGPVLLVLYPTCSIQLTPNFSFHSPPLLELERTKGFIIDKSYSIKIEITFGVLDFIDCRVRKKVGYSMRKGPKKCLQ